MIVILLLILISQQEIKREIQNAKIIDNPNIIKLKQIIFRKFIKLKLFIILVLLIQYTFNYQFLPKKFYLKIIKIIQSMVIIILNFMH